MPGHAFLLVRLPGLGPQPIPSSRTPSSAVFYLTPLSGASPGCRPLLGPTVSLLLWGLIKGIYTSLRLLLLILQRLRCESPLEDCLPASAIWLSEVSLDPQSFPSLLLESYLARRPALSRWPLRLCLVTPLLDQFSTVFLNSGPLHHISGINLALNQSAIGVKMFQKVLLPQKKRHPPTLVCSPSH